MLKLKEIFPTETEAALEDALQFSINVEDAVETLVKKTAGQYQYKVMMCLCHLMGCFICGSLSLECVSCSDVFKSNLNCCFCFVSISYYNFSWFEIVLLFGSTAHMPFSDHFILGLPCFISDLLMS